MIGRNGPPKVEEAQAQPRGFDDFDLRLGDIMRGERATMGKSLLDVQRELKIKASFIASIENADPSAFETPGFVAGYVRSYSRYLGLDPEWAFETFCREANFVSPSTADKLGSPPSSKAPVYRKSLGGSSGGKAGKREGYNPFVDSRVSFAPKSAGTFTNLEPRAIGSTLVLLALIGAVSYGGWSVLQEIQRVTVTPVDRAPNAIAVVDPLSDVRHPAGTEEVDVAVAEDAPVDPLDRLYRPQTLDLPVMVARDGPIAALDPRSSGTLAGAGNTVLAGREDAGTGLVAGASRGETGIDAAIAEALSFDPATPRVTAAAPDVVIVAVHPAWVRVRAADGSTLLEKILNPGETYIVPQTDEPPTLRTGAGGAIYFAVNGQTYGPAGANGEVVDRIALNSGFLTESFAIAEASDGADAERAVAVAQAVLAPERLPVETESPQN